MKAALYDGFAARYAAENESSLLNAHYERPAMLELAGDVRGRRILDAGCGSGPLAEALLAKGASVTGIDVSPAMVDLARRRLGPDADLHIADLGEALPFPDDTFDDVVCSLALHYLEDWSAPLAELRRVLVPGGRLLLSVNHPTVSVVNYPGEDYFATREYSEEYEFDGEPAVLTFWHRPLHAMFEAFSGAGFRVVRVAEPAPSPHTPSELLPPRIAAGERSAFLSFIFFVLDAG